MTTIVNIIPNDFWEDAALYIVTLYFGSIVDIKSVGYNCKATSIKSNAIVIDENTNAIMYFSLDTSRGTLATAKKDNTGTVKYNGLFLKVAVTSGIKIKVYSVVIPKVIIKKIIPFCSKKVSLTCNLPSVFNKR